MYKSIDTDSGLGTLNARIWLDGQIGNNVSSAFEAFSAGSVANYNIAAPEQGTGSGRYTALVPAWLPPNLYTMVFYDPSSGLELGTVTCDTRSPAALTVTPSTALSALISSLRTLANDTITDNFVAEETLKPRADAARTKFRMANRNIVSGSVYVTYGSNFRVQTGFTMDLVNGIVTFSSPPAIGDISIDYNHQWFTDADYTEFLTEGGRNLSVTDPSTIAVGIAPALLQFGLHYFFNRRATQYAHRYASTGGQAGQSVQSVTDAFRKLAKAAWDQAMGLRDDYYKNQGKNLKPASATIRYGFDSFTPRR